MTSHIRTADPTGVLHDLFRPIRAELAQVEKLLARELYSVDPQLGPLLQHASQLAGKRLRPALLLLVGQACGQITCDHHVMAAVVEIIHTATLLHDDVLDKAAVRRHLPTINARWGDHTAILLGDYLFSHAFYLASTTGNAAACVRIGKATNTVCAGEIRQQAARGNWNLSEQEYLEIAAAKTGALCACSCEIGALLAGRPQPEIARWADFGSALGVAFQIVDDLIDVLGDEAMAGKSVNRDAAQQIASLPWIYAWQELDDGERSLLADWLENLADDARGLPAPAATEPSAGVGAGGSRQWLLWLEKTRAVQRAWHTAKRYADLARNLLDGCHDSPAGRTLARIVDFVLERPC
ncbi:MAG: polyprenyl synthetase [Pirellulaceae bacterium]|nr:MAG: polyprenyl synthetase [Pirellulaceae bacterium]